MTESQIFNLGIILAVVGTLILLAVAWVVLCKQFRHSSRVRRLDTMGGLDFEHYCADLLAANGFVEVEVTQASGDYGVDILAEKDGVTYAIQCKRYNNLVGVKAVQEAYAGRDFYDRMVGCVLTNQYFTKPAAEAARKLKILLWDRDFLQSLEEE